MSYFDLKLFLELAPEDQEEYVELFNKKYDYLQKNYDKLEREKAILEARLQNMIPKAEKEDLEMLIAQYKVQLADTQADNERLNRKNMEAEELIRSSRAMSKVDKNEQYQSNKKRASTVHDSTGRDRDIFSKFDDKVYDSLDNSKFQSSNIHSNRPPVDTNYEERVFQLENTVEELIAENSRLIIQIYHLKHKMEL